MQNAEHPSLHTIAHTLCERQSINSKEYLNWNTVKLMSHDAFEYSLVHKWHIIITRVVRYHEPLLQVLQEKTTVKPMLLSVLYIVVVGISLQ